MPALLVALVAGGLVSASPRDSMAEPAQFEGEPRVRHSVRALQSMYEAGDTKPLEDVIRAWHGITKLSHKERSSFFVLGGYHGEPFIDRPAVDHLGSEDGYAYWGGYCNHGNVLFPTWHRVYCYKVEEALRSIVPDVTLPYWDETSEESLAKGIPWVLTAETFTLDGEEIPNPLRSFKLPEALPDLNPADGKLYAKPKGYRTVRYPLSGLVGTPEALKKTLEHNARFSDPTVATRHLNENVTVWLNAGGPKHMDRPRIGIQQEFANCLAAPNYTVFSNTTSATAWSSIHPTDPVTPLESPHNDIHLAVGGYQFGDFNANFIQGANGDMGENNTAGLDPIFFFHHCNVDRMFWLWQQRHGKTDAFTIAKGYAGTFAFDSQGPTPGVSPGTALTLKTPLAPFVKDLQGTPYTSKDCFNIETQMGYTYGPGSFDDEADEPAAIEAAGSLLVKGLSRAKIRGSFVIHATAKVGDETIALGSYSVLSRTNVEGCANCQSHLDVNAVFRLPELDWVDWSEAEFDIEVDARDPDAKDLETETQVLLGR